MLGVALWISGNRLDKCKTNAATLTASLASAVSANKSNIDTISELQAANALNAAQREAVAARSNAAEVRIIELTNQLENSLGEPFETPDTNCRTLIEPLPADFVCWLQDGSNCSH